MNAINAKEIGNEKHLKNVKKSGHMKNIKQKKVYQQSK